MDNKRNVKSAGLPWPKAATGSSQGAPLLPYASSAIRDLTSTGSTAPPTATSTSSSSHNEHPAAYTAILLAYRQHHHLFHHWQPNKTCTCTTTLFHGTPRSARFISRSSPSPTTVRSCGSWRSPSMAMLALGNLSSISLH